MKGQISMSGLPADQEQRSAPTLTKAERVALLRKKMAAIPARSDTASPAVLPAADEPTPIVATATSTLRLLPVPAPFQELLRRCGLVRGTVIHVSGTSSVLVGLLASVTEGGGHAAVIGMPGLGLLAALEMGADLSRVATIPDPGDSAVDVAFSFSRAWTWSFWDFQARPSLQRERERLLRGHVSRARYWMSPRGGGMV
ncbi:hypothetical protein [Rhodococcus sp. LB1]|uniref:hypothetical protein n=1 Tax=Rhodococcus sp. LB1 TaxID=1807499 RepID=UPI000A4FA926